mgnify:CR=1 FL=1
MPSWSNDDKQILREQYPTTSAKELSKTLGRSENAIHSKASRMGIEKQSYGKHSTKCKDCGESYDFGGELSWRHTSLCRACYDRQRRFGQAALKAVRP